MSNQVSQIDVVINGAGPSGLFAAVNLVHMGLSVRIVDTNLEPIKYGRAHAISQRTLELFHIFGFDDELIPKGISLNRIIAFQNGIKDSTSIAYYECDSRFKMLFVTAQPNIEGVLYRDLEKQGILVERPCSVVDFAITDDHPTHPVVVRIKDMVSGAEEEVQAKFLLGCDGAHSFIRNHLGIQFEGETIDLCWGAIDAWFDTDLPIEDGLTTAQGPNGFVGVVPREEGLRRIYLPLDFPGANRSTLTEEQLLERAKVTFQPFTLEFKEVQWSTVYVVNERNAKNYSYKERVFLCGDACHNHSPKAGQGLNLGLGDGFNLAWKLAMFDRGLAQQSILLTYQTERRTLAQSVIELDAQLTRAVTTFKAAPADGSSSATQEYMKLREQNAAVISGLGVEYDSNILVMRSDESSKLKVYAGQRTLDLEVIRQADGVPIRLCDTSEMLSVGKFRAMVFAGDLSVDLQILGATADVLSSVVRRFGVHTDALEILTIVIAEKVNRLLLPKLLAGRSVYGDRAGDGSCHFGYGVDVNKGVVVLVRPDGWIGCCAELGNNGVLERYFDGFLVPNA